MGNRKKKLKLSSSSKPRRALHGRFKQGNVRRHTHIALHTVSRGIRKARKRFIPTEIKLDSNTSILLPNYVDYSELKKSELNISETSSLLAQVLALGAPTPENLLLVGLAVDQYVKAFYEYNPVLLPIAVKINEDEVVERITDDILQDDSFRNLIKDFVRKSLRRHGMDGGGPEKDLTLQFFVAKGKKSEFTEKMKEMRRGKRYIAEIDHINDIRYIKLSPRRESLTEVLKVIVSYVDGQYLEWVTREEKRRESSPKRKMFRKFLYDVFNIPKERQNAFNSIFNALT